MPNRASELPITAVVFLLFLVAVPLALSSPAAGATTCSFPVTTTDATGTSVTVSAEPAEVVTLAPSAAQTMWEIGARGKVTGVSPQAAYLSGTSSLTTVTTYPSVDAETVVDLDPDLVLAPNAIADEDVQRLRSLGLSVYKFEEAETIEDVYAKTTLTGRLVGACPGAEETVADMKAAIDAAREALEGKQPEPVFYHMGGGWTAGGGTFIDEIITTAGGENVAATAGIEGYQVISPEVMVSQDPSWFIRGSVPVPDTSPYADTTAGRENRSIVVDTNYLNQPAPRIVYPIETIAEALHPDVSLDIAGESGTNADLTADPPEYDQEVSADGALSVSVSGLYANRSARLTFPADAGTNAGGSVDVRSVDLTLGEPNPDFLVTVADSSDDVPPIDDSGVTTVKRVSVTANGLWPEEVTRATLRVDVHPDATGDGPVDPDRVTLYRYEAGEWSPLNTSAVSHDNGTVTATGTASTIGTVAVGVRSAVPPTEGAPETTDAGTGSTGPASPADPTPTASDVNADASGDAAATTTAATGEPGTGSPGQPGFGPLGAVVAIVGGLLIWNRGVHR